MPIRYIKFPEIVDFPASTCPMNTNEAGALLSSTSTNSSLANVVTSLSSSLDGFGTFTFPVLFTLGFLTSGYPSYYGFDFYVEGFLDPINSVSWSSYMSIPFCPLPTFFPLLLDGP
jgi:hypothetical protein